MSTQAVIRPARAADLPQVLALIRALAEFEKLPPPDDAAAQHFYADFAATPARFHLLVAERDDAVIGYALYFYTYSTFLAQPSLYLEDLFVRPEQRSLGVGREFLVELARLAVEQQCGRFEWTVLDWNVRAQSFYRSLGARILPEWHVCRVDGAALRELAGGITRCTE